MKRTTLVILASLACASAAVAVKQASAQNSGTPSPLDQLNFPLGDWKCTGNEMAMDKKPGHATTGQAHSDKILDGNWVAIHYDENRTAANTEPYHVVQYIGYDSAKKQFVSVTLDNTGSSYGAGTSPGWKDNALTVDETLSASKVAYRDTFTRNGSDELTHTGTMKDKNNKWLKTDEETCHKS